MTRKDTYVISSSGVKTTKSQFPPPKVIGPSLTYRKFINLPENISRDTGKVKKELFGQALPDRTGNYSLQFLDLEAPESGRSSILGLAVESAAVKSHLNAGAQLYFWEALLNERSVKRKALFEIPFPTGEFYGFYNSSLCWTRYILKKSEGSLDQVEEYLESEFQPGFKTNTLPEFETGGAGKEWRGKVEELLPETPPAARSLTASSGKTISFKSPALWVLLVLSLLNFGLWGGTQKYLQSQYSQWLTSEFNRIVGRSPRYPLEELEVALSNLESDDPGEKRSPGQFKAMEMIDSASEHVSARLLRISLARGQGKLVMMVPSVSRAEDYKGALLKAGAGSVDIVSTNSREIDDYDFEVQMDFEWGNKR